MTEINEGIFQILGRLTIAVDGNSRAKELINILEKKLKNLPLNGDYERVLLFAHTKPQTAKKWVANTAPLSKQELREDHVYGEVLEQELMEAQDDQNII